VLQCSKHLVKLGVLDSGADRFIVSVLGGCDRESGGETKRHDHDVPREIPRAQRRHLQVNEAAKLDHEVDG